MNHRVLIISLSMLIVILIIWMGFLAVQVSRLTVAPPQTLSAVNVSDASGTSGTSGALSVDVQAPSPQPTVDENPSIQVMLPEKLRVGLVMPSSITDLTWGQAMFDSLFRVQQEVGGDQAMEISISQEMFRVPEAIPILRDYASQGYDLIIAHGTQYGEPLFEIAAEYPETTFLWGTAFETGADRGLSNVFAYNARSQEGGYVNGVIAASLTQSGVIGVVGPIDAGDAKEYIRGFSAGVHATDPAIEVLIEFTGSFADVTLAAEVANRHIEAGADVLTGTGQQVVGAISMASQNNIPWLGTQSDQSVLAPELVVASQIYDWSPIIREALALRQAGTLGGNVYSISLSNGGLKIKFNEEIEVPEELKVAADNAIRSIVEGSIQP